MRFSIWLKPTYSWADVLRIAEDAQRSGWEGVWCADHFMPARGDLSAPFLECWATLAGLAAAVPRVRIGALVTANTYRHPAVLAKTAVTTDQISGGRVVLGIGAGWQKNEHEAYGLEFATAGGRLDRLEEACRVITGLREQERLTFSGRHYQLEDAPLEPKPVGRLPLLVGGGGERRTIPIAARYAEEWNVWGTVETFAHKSAVLDGACLSNGRDPAEMRRSTQALVAPEELGPAGVVTATHRPVLRGSMQQLLDVLGSYADAGADEFIVPTFNLPSADVTIELMQALTEEVIPSLRAPQR